jgi:hypothetical protein
MYRPHDPLTATPMLWPVYGYHSGSFAFRPQTLAVFFDQAAATDFALHPEIHGFEKRNVYMAAPRYDRR